MEILVNILVILIIVSISYYSLRKFIIDSKNKKCSCSSSCSKEQRKNCSK